MSRKTLTVMESKNGERRTVPLNQKASEVLMAMHMLKKADDGYVFTTANGTRILRWNLRRKFVKALKKAKVKKFRFHDLRHSFAHTQPDQVLVLPCRARGHIHNTWTESELNIDGGEIFGFVRIFYVS